LFIYWRMTDSQMLVAGQLDATGEQTMVTRLLNWTELEHIQALADQQSSLSRTIQTGLVRRDDATAYTRVSIR